MISREADSLLGETLSRPFTSLLIDDDPSDRALFVERLAALDSPACSVVAVDTLAGAEAVLRAHEIEVCLLDYDLDGKTGAELLLSLREAGLVAPVLILSAVDHQEADLACLAAGADGFLSKRHANVRTLERTLRYLRAQAIGRRRLSLASRADPVTSTLHRLAFLEDLSKLLVRPVAGTIGRPTSVAYFGIRGFKGINARHGRTVGDQVLRECARRLQERLGPLATLGRMVGDEFAAFVSGARRGSLNSRVQDAVQRCAEPIELDGGLIKVEMVAGVSSYPYDAVTANLLLERAELAMRSAKETSAPGTVRLFELSQLEKMRYRDALERDLRLAIERDRLTIVFEPVIRTRDRKTVGAEVLSRWEHRTHGWVSPGEFIPVAEESGLILSLTDSVVAKTALCLRDWLRSGLIDASFRAYINVPSAYLELPDAESRLLEPWLAQGLAPQMLGLELTERALIDMDGDSGRLLERLRTAGVSLVIDDFGTGFSSLSYLCQLPVDQIKIDRSLLVASQTNPRGVLVIRSILALGVSLGLKVLAEGVETPAMEELVLQEGAEYVQGYLYGRPKTADAFAAELTQTSN